jgi:hypothetical protein
MPVLGVKVDRVGILRIDFRVEAVAPADVGGIAVRNAVSVTPCPVPYDVTSRKKLLPFSGNVRAMLF